MLDSLTKRQDIEDDCFFVSTESFPISRNSKQDFVRVFAETTGFAVKPIAPPALPADDELPGRTSIWNK